MDRDTGRITGICGWQDAEVRTFGLSLWNIETILGVESHGHWTYYASHDKLRDLFRATLQDKMPDLYWSNENDSKPPGKWMSCSIAASSTTGRVLWCR